MPATTLIAQSEYHGTPAAQNSVFEAIIEPAFHHAGGIPDMYSDIIHVNTPEDLGGGYGNFAMLKMARYEDGEKQRKTFRPISKHADGWQCTNPSGKWPLYCLPALADAGRVFICAGEKALTRPARSG